MKFAGLKCNKFPSGLRGFYPNSEQGSMPMSISDVTCIKAVQSMLDQHNFPALIDVRPLQGDASTRRYFRLNFQNSSLIVMDCRQSQEVIEPFVGITQLLAQQNLPVPSILASDFTEHLLLLEDFGDTTLLASLGQLQEGIGHNAGKHIDHQCFVSYQKAIHLLLKIQKIPREKLGCLPIYDEKKLMQECKLMPSWFFNQLLKIELDEHDDQTVVKAFGLLVNNAIAQPSCLVHRDYHSRNLMLKSDNTLGVIDYQDAVIGPIVYDWVSLLKDCYVCLPRKVQLSLLREGYDQLKETHALPSWSNFLRDFDWIGLQRHLKVLGVFARLALRDGKTNYLKDIPRVLSYVIDTCQAYEDLHGLLPIMQKAAAHFMSQYQAEVVV